MIRKVFLGLAALPLLAWIAALAWPQPAYDPHQPSAEYVVAAAAYRTRNLTAMPEGWRWDYFEAGDGNKMRWGVVAPEGPVRGTVIFVPGFTGALEMYADYHHEMLTRYYRVYGFDLRGQGGSARMLQNPEKHWVEDFSVYSDDLADFVRQVREEVDGPLVLMGESFGGHVALRAVGDHDLPIDGLFLATPAIKIKTGDQSYNLTRRIVDISRALGFSKRYAMSQQDWQPYRTDFEQGNYCGENLERIHLKDTLYTVRPELRVGGVTNQWLGEIMESTEHITKPAYLEEIELPVFVATGDSDTIVEADLSTELCKRQFPKCTVFVLEDSGHCTISEPEPTRRSLFAALDAMFFYIEGAGQ